ncbi:MAG: helix-turn-helix transcriptional regulator [Kiritimatiellae bacterium]|nr:helix-turn-helix transcriptional regulator [Kiritimatiellia bacterium]
MDHSTTHIPETYREERFRTPLESERKMGLWVDRIGEGIRTVGTQVWGSRLRILGQYAVVYTEAGDGEFVWGTNRRAAVGRQDVIVLFPEIANRYDPVRVWTQKWIVWNGPEAGTLEALGYLSPEHPVLRDAAGAVPRAYRALKGIMQSESLWAVLERKSIILAMVLELSGALRQAQRPRHTDAAMEDAVAHLRAHYAEAPAIPALARRAGLSSTHFRRLFRAYTGSSPKDFLTAQRVSKAKELLASGLPIKETAARVGYEDPFYFMRVFKKVVGVPPGRFVARGCAT